MSSDDMLVMSSMVGLGENWCGQSSLSRNFCLMGLALMVSLAGNSRYSSLQSIRAAEGDLANGRCIARSLPRLRVTVADEPDEPDPPSSSSTLLARAFRCRIFLTSIGKRRASWSRSNSTPTTQRSTAYLEARMAPFSCECNLHTRLLATSSFSSLIFRMLRISVHSFWLSLTRVVACVSISWQAVSSVDFSPSPCSARSHCSQ
uniref:Uncharacterized protein n=1 Tax=Anopheles atroparvus TaxID=41427 RepID=A0A182JAZ8_ANOAO